MESEFIHVKEPKSLYTLLFGNLTLRNSSSRVLLDSSEPPTKDFCRKESCMPRTSAPKFIFSYGRADRTLSSINLERYTDSGICSKSVLFGDTIRTVYIFFRIFCTVSGLTRIASRKSSAHRQRHHISDEIAAP